MARDADPAHDTAMTLYEFTVPLIAFAVAGGGNLILRAQGRKLDRRPPAD